MSCTKLQLPPEPTTRGLPHPDPLSLCPLSSTEFVEHPRTKFLGTPLAQTLVPKLFLQQMSAVSFPSTPQHCNKLQIAQTPASATPKQLSSNFRAPEATAFGRVCFQSSRPILLLPTVTARVLWFGAVRLQPFNGTWFGTCVILSWRSFISRWNNVQY